MPHSLVTPAMLVAILFAACKNETAPRFHLRTAAETGIDFTNTITERDTLNILDMEFVYNGGGVAVGDLNGDGLDDLYFTGNQVDNRLYLNRGNLRFEDVTKAANAGKPLPYQWSSGINILDINTDGKQDIYICNTTNPDPEQRRNVLLINQGNDDKGIPHFTDMARAYHLDDANHDSNAQFFDYDLDGDLDVFIGVNFIDHQYPNQFFTRTTDGSAPTRDLLLRNDFDAALGHPVFTDVSLAAGIVYYGYSHSTLINDFNLDGWPDIFVANDYMSNDLVYINNHDGTFTNKAAAVLKHQAMSSMGTDIADVNNDGRLDFFATEMQPWYNKRKKLFQSGSSYQMYLYNEQYKYEYQYTRNMLQVNAGINPETGLPLFCEMGMFAGVQETDWSWTPLLADLDNDGVRDLFVANGFPRDVTDHDFAEFRKDIASTLVSRNEMYNMIPQIRQPNFMFKGRTDGQGVWNSTDVTRDWGLFYPSFTNGAVYADLDKDGDLDLVTNNIDEPAFVFENQTIQQEPQQSYLRIQLKGDGGNTDAFGATAKVWWNGQCQAATKISARGYISASEPTLHFGLGHTAQVDSVEIYWPALKIGDSNLNRRRSVQYGVNTNQTIVFNVAQSGLAPLAGMPQTWLVNVADSIGMTWLADENDHIDFNFQRTLPHKFSQYGPPVAIGDVNGDGLEDMYLGGTSRYNGQWWWQQPGGKFLHDSVAYKTDLVRREEESAVLLFDADGDNDLDLYLGRGSGQHPADDTLYQDVLCLNDGKGHFRIQPDALPVMRNNTSCVKAADYDGDGDLDLFVGSRLKPKSYPMPDRCYLLRNNGGRFEDVTPADLQLPGMISDALWSDYNNDNRPDLVLAGEFMPVTFFKNINGRLVKDGNALTSGHITGAQPDFNGWWNSLSAADLDNDGDMDFVVGNFGENLYFHASPAEPIRVYAKDFDNSGTIDPFISQYWQDSLRKRDEYIYHPREDAVKQLVLFRKKFKTYGEYGAANMSKFFTPKELKGATILSATNLRTSILENIGYGKFRLRRLPDAAQVAPVYGILVKDMDQDGLQDIILTGNDYGIELQQGRADAFQGLVLRNTGNWQFAPVDLSVSGFVVPGDARGVAALLVGGREHVAAIQNRNWMKVFAARQSATPAAILLQPGEAWAICQLKNGRQRRCEFAWGNGFAAQSGRHFVPDAAVSEVVLYGRNGVETRRVAYAAQ